MTRPSTLQSRAPLHTVHPVYVRMLCGVLEERGLDVPALLLASGLKMTDVGDSASPVGLPQVLTLLRLVSSQCQDPLLAIIWGRRLRPSVHGIAGTAIFSSRDVRQALETVVEISNASNSPFLVALQDRGSKTILEYEAVAPLYGQYETLTTAISLMVVNVLQSLLGRSISRVCVEYPFAPPVWNQEREQHCPCGAIFNAPRLGFSLPSELLDRTIASVDTRAHEAALRQCRLDSLEWSARLSARVAAYLGNTTGAAAFPTLDETASHFCVSSRTLRRSLRDEGTSYQQLLDFVRMEMACHLLKDSGLSIQQIAENVGYAEPSNFIRAFRRHHGKTPRQHRFQ